MFFAWLGLLWKIKKSDETEKRKSVKLRIVYLLLASDLAAVFEIVSLLSWMQPKPVVHMFLNKTVYRT
jgi:hypothetical protein